jgi:hypothetical protein
MLWITVNRPPIATQVDSMIRHERQDRRGEFRDEFEEIRALMRPSFSQLDKWVQTLESESSTL